MAFPRLNLLSWWLYMAGAVIVLVSLFTGGGPPDTGWTFYVPLQRPHRHQRLPGGPGGLHPRLLLDPHRAELRHHHPPPAGAGHERGSACRSFAWSLYATAWVQILATPVIGITLLLRRRWSALLGIGFFDPARGGDPILYQHLFWIYSHPAVYIMILPAMGVISEIIPVFSRKPIFGYKMIACLQPGHRHRRLRWSGGTTCSPAA